jgi:hypothetical protein
MEQVTEHVTQAGQTQNPAIPDDLHRSQSFIRMRGEILFARLHQVPGLVMESGLDDHRGQTKHIGLALISDCRRSFPRDCGTPGKQRGFKVTGIHGLRFCSQQIFTIFDVVTVPQNKAWHKVGNVGLYGWDEHAHSTTSRGFY